jgi:choline transport protein
MVFVGYQVVNTVAYFFNCYGKILPRIATIALYTSLISFFVILVTVPARAPTHQNARFVFANFVNNTGWSQNGIAFIVGLINTNWAFACLDSATHLAEEVAKPEKMIPIAIMGTVGIGFITAFCYSISMFFSMNNLVALFNTKTGVPILELFHQAVGNKAGAIMLEVLIIATGLGCQVACHTWQARLCWSFARDRGLPGSKYWAKVDERLEIPLNAHTMSCIWVAILGTLYLGSYTAFNR